MYVQIFVVENKTEIQIKRMIFQCMLFGSSGHVKDRAVRQILQEKQQNQLINLSCWVISLHSWQTISWVETINSNIKNSQCLPCTEYPWSTPQYSAYSFRCCIMNSFLHCEQVEKSVTLCILCIVVNAVTINAKKFFFQGSIKM